MTEGTAMKVDPFVEEVRGVIIGPYRRRGRVYYQDRPQGEAFYAETEEELMAEAKARIAEYQAMPTCYLTYPDKTAWTVRLYDD